MGKLPASLFYWGDFLRDPDLRRCTHAEVGVWMRLLCLMFEAEHKGLLATNGTVWSDEEICMAVGGRYEETLACVTSLVTKGVASRNEHGALMNRRMYRDEKERVDTRERVRKHREKVALEESSNGECNEVGNAKDTRCTETEDETETEVVPLHTSEAKGKDNSERQTIAEQEEKIYLAYPRKIGRGAALKAIRKAVDGLQAGSQQMPAMTAHEARRWLWKQAATYAASPAGHKPQGDDMRPHPATWFNQERYFDDPAEWQKTGGSTNGKPNRSHDIAASTNATLAIRRARSVDAEADSDGGGAHAITTARSLFERPHAQLVAKNPG